MAPLILHNVPDDERYVGDDGVVRPYAMVFPHSQDGGPPNQRPRRAVAEKGSFGKSTRRSRSKTATPARREDPTIAAADALFETWKTEQLADDGSKSTAATPQRKSGLLPSQPKLSSGMDEAPASSPVRAVHKEPTEMILRGYRGYQQQYAAINHYEQLAGRICEDYSRDPPIENRRYKSELRDPAFTRSQPLTPEERAKVNRPDGGEHWVKVTFESAQAADAAVYASPQRINGHLVYAEPYHGIPPARDEAVPDPVVGVERPWPVSREHTPEPFSAFARAAGREPSPDVVSDLGGLDGQRLPSPEPRRGRSGRSDAYRWGNGSGSSLDVDDDGQPYRRDAGKRRPAQAPRHSTHPRDVDVSPPHSNTSSRTMDTGTIATNTTTATSETITGGIPMTPGRQQQQQQQPPTTTTASPAENSIFCRSVPGVRKATLLSAEQALLPRPSYTQRVVLMIPFLSWFSGSMIGNEVPRTDTGEFDWNKASLYWKLIWWLDFTFKLFGGEILNTDKED